MVTVFLLKEFQMKSRNNVYTVHIRDSIDSSAGARRERRSADRLLGSRRFPEAVPLALEETHRTGTVHGKQSQLRFQRPRN